MILTLSALFVLQEWFKDTKDEWKLIESKARAYIKKNYPGVNVPAELAKFKSMIWIKVKKLKVIKC